MKVHEVGVKYYPRNKPSSVTDHIKSRFVMLIVN